MKVSIFGLFDTDVKTKTVIDRLKSSGYGTKHITVVARYIGKESKEPENDQAEWERLLIEGPESKSNWAALSVFLDGAFKYDHKDLGRMAVSGNKQDHFQKHLENKKKDLAGAFVELGLEKETAAEYVAEIKEKKLALMVDVKMMDSDHSISVFENAGASNLVVKGK